jgi:mono/diheme cytochrome c family protein
MRIKTFLRQLLKGNPMNSGKKLIRSLPVLSLLMLLSSLFAATAFADGASVYNSNCASCHRLGTYDTTGSDPNLLGKGSQVSSYYSPGVSGHKGRTLTATNITELAAFLNNPTTTTSPLAITTASLAGGTVGSSYSQTLAASGGRTPYTWARSAGTLPTGLTLSTSGVISGTPSATGTFSFTARVTDSASPTVSVTRALSITVAAATTSSGSTVYNNRCASCHRLGTYDTSGTAPNLLGDGSRIDSYYTAGRSGHRSITLTASEITALKAFINNPTPTSTALAISTASLASATVGTAYSQTLAASGGRTPYTWSRYSGTLPTGLTISTSGLISGTPSATGTFSFTVRVRDSASTQASATKALTITVNPNVPPLVVSTSTLPSGTVGTAYSQSLSASGGLSPYTWSYSGSLPAGIVVTSAGLVTGTPSAAGSYSFNVLVTDSRASTAIQALTVAVGGAPMTTADKTLFLNNCSNCHTPFGLEGRSSSQIRTAISGNVGGMGTSQLNGLTSANLDGIAKALTPSTPPANQCAVCHSPTTPPPASSPGQALYDLQCAGCHSLGTYDTNGSPDLLGRSSTVAGKFGSAHYGISLNATDITNVTAFISNPSGTPSPTPTPTPTPTCGSCHGTPPSGGSHSISGHRSRSCSSCHGSGFSSTTVNTATHNNGVKNVISSTGWNASNSSCSSNSCHGSESWTPSSTSTPSPTPTPTPTQSCTSCHGNPPSTGSHSDHRSRSCSSCHGSGFSSTTVNTATHNNGVKNIVTNIGWNASNRSCSSNSCHGSESW